MFFTLGFAVFFAVVFILHTLVRRPSLRPKRVVFVLLPYLALTLLVEVAVRVALPQVGETVYPGYPPGLVVPDDALGHAYQPGFSGRFPQSRYSDIPIEINSAACRDIEWPDPASDDRTRILVLGDSITFGSPVRREERFSEVAAAALAARGRRVLMMNCGVNGYNLEQYGILLKRIGESLRPDLVLVGLCLNDAEPMSKADATRIAGARGDVEARRRLELRSRRLDPGRSYAWSFLSRFVKGRLWASERWAPRLMKRYDKRTQEGLRLLYEEGDGRRRLRDGFRLMRDLALTRWNAQVTAVVFPYHTQLKAGDSSLPDMAASVLGATGVPHRNLFADFATRLGETGLYAHRDDCHPGILGHKIAGEAVAELIEPLL